MPDPTEIFAWHRIDDQIATSGQLKEEELSSIRDLGVRVVVNLALHTHERALPDERASVQALGMSYIHVPVQFDAPTEQDFQKFCSAMESVGDAKAHVHCIVNARVSAFLYRYRRDVLGINEARARDDLEEFWKPGGVWAVFIGDDSAVGLPHGPGRRRSKK